MTIFARLTRPLRPLDRASLWVSDSRLGRASWVWWPARPPRRDRPWSAGQHGVYVGWSIIGFLISDVAGRMQPREDPRALRRERTLTIVTSILWWVGSAGAWDRRAERLRRRPWRRLLGS